MFSVGEPRIHQYMNINWIGPALMRYGTAEQKGLHLPQITGGKVLFWCQGFSEPSASSDLAGLKTRAERSGSELRQFYFLLARTGATKWTFPWSRYQ